MADASIKPIDAINVADSFPEIDNPYDAKRIERGHINDTFHIWAWSGEYVLQCINDDIFKHPVEVMHNIKLALNQVHKSISENGGDPSKEALTLIQDKEGLHYSIADNGNVWRCYNFVPGKVYDELPSGADGVKLAFKAAQAFGNFQKQLAGLNPNDFKEAIPNFHSGPYRYDNFIAAYEADVVGRRAECEKESNFVFERRDTLYMFENAIQSGDLQRKVIHGDTKINNIIFGDTEVIIDLDTIGDGNGLFDVGYLLRSAPAIGAEDQPDLDQVGLDLDIYRAVIHGYLDAVGDLLTPYERDNLVNAGIVFTEMIGTRFLTDHLQGDIYFRISRENHNLDRARTQFKAVEEMEKNYDALQGYVKAY